MHVASTNTWIDRRIDFGRADADSERERTVAFAMVSILPEPPSSTRTAWSDPDAGATSGGGGGSGADGGTGADGANGADGGNGANSANEDDESEAPRASSTSSASSASSTSSTSSASSASNASDAGAPGPTAPNAAARQTSTGSFPDSTPPSSPTAPSTMGLEVLVVDAAGDGQGAQEIGGAAAFDWFFWRNVSVRVGGSVRDTSVDAASGDVLKVVGSAGLALHPWRATTAHHFGASLRIDYVLLYERLSPVGPPGQTARSHDDVLSGCDAAIDGSWLFAPSVEVIGGAGVEAFAPTTIKQGGTPIASLPIAHALLEGGLRLRF
jgi:hypothetical protein